MKYRVIKLIERKDKKFEGVAMLDEQEKEYITNGVFIWEASPHRKGKCNEVDSIDKDKFLRYWNKYYPNYQLEFFTEIKTSEQFREIRDSQNAKELCTRADVAEVVEKFQSEGKQYTIFSIQDESDIPWYITYGIRYVNNIGYYVLEGNFTLPNDINL